MDLSGFESRASEAEARLAALEAHIGMCLLGSFFVQVAVLGMVLGYTAIRTSASFYRRLYGDDTLVAQGFFQ